MTNDNTSTLNKPTYIFRLITYLPAAVTHYLDPLHAIEQRLQELRGRTCTGHAHWRDKNTEGKTAKLYILHGTDQACPIHGQPPRGRRTRHYVGNKPDKISDALAAIERETEYQTLQKDLTRLEGTIGYVTYQLKTIYRYLHVSPPNSDHDTPAIPPDQRQMKTE